MYATNREETKEKIEAITRRSIIENSIRNLLLTEGFIEVKTPIINRYADIAPITQFKVDSPLEKTELYLRIAPTEFLKKLMFEGFEKVFEFSTNFRNDLIDDKHLFEFTSLEIMERYKTVFDKMDQTEKIIKNCINLCNSNGYDEGNEFYQSLYYEWPRINIIEFFKEKYDIDLNNSDDDSKLFSIYNNYYGKYQGESKASIISKIVDDIVIKYNTPVFIGNFPWNIEGPAKASNTYGKERYELYYKDIELANMSSTLVNKEQLLTWYYETIAKKNLAEGKEYKLDPELLEIFNNQMPDSAVVGIGIDRLIMLLLGKEKISDVVCYNNETTDVIKRKREKE